MPTAKQPKLFETSQTAEMLSGLRSYQDLTERQQDVVRAYIDAHEQREGRIQKKDWIAQAKAYGVSKSRYYEILSEAPQAIWAAITEALQYTGEQAAQYGALALYACGLRLYEQIMAGERETRHLTSVELGIMRECVNSLSPARMLAFTAQDGKGGSVQGAVAGRSGGDGQELASQAASVVGALREELGLGGEAEKTPEAGSEASSPESVQAAEAGAMTEGGQATGGEEYLESHSGDISEHSAGDEDSEDGE